ncbi:hypothetical protein TNCV_2836721 [Trichonephila clavipes]|nr:hypothetical protein TNCV_2836721 [Trichonephila clavipes]
MWRQSNPQTVDQLLEVLAALRKDIGETLRKHYGTLEREKSGLYRKRHTKNIFYKQVKKSSTQVITAQGAKCRNMGVVELNIQNTDFEKPLVVPIKQIWNTHVFLG